MNLKINIDAKAIAEGFKELFMEVEDDLKRAVGDLAAMTHARVLEMAQKELSTSLKMFQENVEFVQVADGIWIVGIKDKAMWIEEGLPQGHDMKPDLLKGATKTSKDGHRYRAIPFDHGKPPQQNTPTAQSYVDQIKRVLRQEKIPFKKIEKNADGSPRTGKLHKLDIDSSIPGRGNTPALQGLSIYQTVTKSGNVRRDILTFRTVSEGPGSDGKWIHPGYKAEKFLDKAYEWAMNEWEQVMLPAIMEKWSK